MTLNLHRCGCVALLLILVALPCSNAQKAPASGSNPWLASPVGRWKTVDDVTGKIKSIVAIREQNGVLYGTVERVFDPPVPNPLCIHCTGSFKDRPVIGLQILWGLRKDGSQWSGGQILDPETGRIYRCYVALEDGGRKLRIRGYIGLSVFGRTEHWLRVE